MNRRGFLRLVGLGGAVTLLRPAWALAQKWVLNPPVLSASLNNKTVTLSWTDAGDEMSYEVYRGTSPTNLVRIATLPANTRTYVDTVP